MFKLIKKNLDRHIKLTTEEFDIFRERLTVKTYQKDDYLTQSGEICKNTYFVNKGLLRLYDINEKGREKNTLFAKAMVHKELSGNFSEVQ